MNSKNKQLQKLILSALFISFSIILNYHTKYIISGFSLRNSFLIFSSILLGSKYGAIIRNIEDFLFNMFFNSVGLFWFDLNIMYTIEGAFPSLCLSLLNKIDKNKKYRFLLLSLVIILIGFLSFLLSFHLIDKDVEKISFPFFKNILLNRKTIFFILICIIAIFYLFLIFINIFFLLIKKNKNQSLNNIDVNGTAITIILTIIIFELLIFPFIIMIHQEISFKICLISRISFAIKHLFLDTIIVLIFLTIANKNKTNFIK